MTCGGRRRTIQPRNFKRARQKKKSTLSIFERSRTSLSVSRAEPRSIENAPGDPYVHIRGLTDAPHGGHEESTSSEKPRKNKRGHERQP